VKSARRSNEKKVIWEKEER